MSDEKYVPQCDCYQDAEARRLRTSMLNNVVRGVVSEYRLQLDMYAFCEKTEQHTTDALFIALLSSYLDESDRGMDSGLEKSLAKLRGFEARIEEKLRVYYKESQDGGHTAAFHKMHTQGEA